MNADAPLLALEDVEVRYRVTSGWFGGADVYAVNGVSLSVAEGETLGIVGESGCGKSTLGQAIVGLTPITAGSIRLKGADRAASNTHIQIIFQDPQSSLDPRLPVWRLITEPLHIRGGYSRKQLIERATELAVSVGLRPEQVDRYPHEFSGGQRQRIAIARAIAVEPELLVLDEPTSALDVSVQAQIVNLLLKLQSDRKLSYALISHDVSLVRHVADRVVVMYLGQIVEAGPAQDVLDKPQHPYTRTLLDAVPNFERPLMTTAPRAGELPSNRKLPTGCYFRERCPSATVGCEQPQLLTAVDSARTVRCHVVTGALQPAG